jgi:hypothetical protein
MALYFLVALQDAAPAFKEALSSKMAAANLYTIEEGKWIIDSPAVTSKDFADSLGVVATESSFIVVPVTGYYGRTQPDLWEWLAAKIAAKNAAKSLATV